MIPSSVHTSRKPPGVLKTKSLGPHSRQKGILWGYWLNAIMSASDLAPVLFGELRRRPAPLTAPPSSM